MRISGKISLADYAVALLLALTAVAVLSADGIGGYRNGSEKNEFSPPDAGEIKKNAGMTSFQTRNIGRTNRSVSKPKPRATPRRTKADASKYQLPGGAEMQRMTRAALLDFNEAVAAGDFTGFHSKISGIWQEQTTPEEFNNVFSEFITKQVDISEIGSSQPIYNPKPEVRRDKGTRKLIAEGCYDVNPRPVKFVLKWIPQGKEWKLFGIEVDTTVESC